MKKAQMFIVTAVFLSSTLFFLQQALVTYSALDSTKPFRAKEVYILKNIEDGINATIKAGGGTQADCIEFQANAEEFLAAVRDDVSAEGYIFSYDTNIDCSRWMSLPSSGTPPYRLSIRIAQTYDANGILDFYHRP